MGGVCEGRVGMGWVGEGGGGYAHLLEPFLPRGVSLPLLDLRDLDGDAPEIRDAMFERERLRKTKIAGDREAKLGCDMWGGKLGCDMWGKWVSERKNTSA